MDVASGSPPPATPGQQLAEARERQGLSRAEVAQRLHMSPSQIEALESGEFGRLPKGTFLRGFVRNYAKLVGLEGESLVANLAQASPGHATPGIVVPSQNIRFEPLHERISASPYWKGGMIAAVVLAFGAAALYWWAEVRNAPPPVAAASSKPKNSPPQQIAVAPLPAPVTPPPTEAPQVDTSPAAATSTPAAQAGTPGHAPGASPAPAAPKKADSVKVAEAKKAESAKAADSKKADAARANEVAKAESAKPGAPVAGNASAPAAVSAGAARLAFKFRGDSWVEVKDASGKVVYSRLNAAGTEARVAGKPPLTVIVGNAPEVTMLYNDRDFPLEPHTKVAVARFTVE